MTKSNAKTDVAQRTGPAPEGDAPFVPWPVRRWSGSRRSGAPARQLILQARPADLLPARGRLRDGRIDWSAMDNPACKRLFSRLRLVRDLLSGFAARGWSGSLDFDT